MMPLRDQTTEFHMNAILPIASYTTGVGFPIQFAYRSKAAPFTGEACETNHSFVRTESCWKKDSRNSSVALIAAISQGSTWYLCASGSCLGVHWAMALIGKPRVGKSGPIETGLTGPAVTAL